MSRIHPGSAGRRVALAFTAWAVVAAQSAIMPQARAEPGDARQIRHLINARFDTPQSKVAIDPVVVQDQHALADWLQGDRGGRALLERREGRWQLLACGGDGFKDSHTLVQAGLPAAQARRLVGKLARAERSVPPARIARFDAFGPTVDLRGESAAHGHAPK